MCSEAQGTFWRLWLDDQASDPNTPVRHPPDGFLAAETLAQAQALVEEYGVPSVMSLDHDLGEERSIDFLKWLADKFPEHPPDWMVHSANPVGRENLNSFMRSWHKSVSL